MRLNLNSFHVVALVMAVSLTGCIEDELSTGEDPVMETESPLQFSVNAFTVCDGTRAAEPSPDPEPETEEERKIENFWLFQFKPDGTKLADPKYYSIPSDGATLNELTAKAYGELTRNTKMTIYVVTNVGGGTWSGSTDFSTLEAVKKQLLREPKPICVGTDKVLIPMSGQIDNVTKTDKSLIVVPVTRMYAKVKIQAKFADQGLNIYDVNVSNIPYFCRTSTVAVEPADGRGEPAAYNYPEDMYTSRAFTSEDAVEDANGTWLTLYLPENICGEIQDADKVAGTNIPSKPLTVDIQAKSDDKEKGTGLDYFYKIYPGGNNVNNFNVERNCVYRVTADVLVARDQHNPSANCYIVKENGIVAFEPYNRDETGGGYNFTQYLDPTNPSKKIARLEIIWQTKDCIGDNSNHDLVYLGPETTPARNQKIYVKTNKEGNALVGAYNSSNKIIWSWHIWVTNLQPDNLGKAIVYTTYSWNSSGINYNGPRIPGYAIMPCNLGALAFRSDDDMTDGVRPVYSLKKGKEFPKSQIKTFGMMYQWGRKDPFPPMTHSTGTEDANDILDYSNNYTDAHYANDNRTKVGKSDTKSGSVLFHSSDVADVPYSIQHPTVYIMGSSMTSNGNWCSPNDNKLWGGLDPNTPGLTKLNVGDGISVYNNYGSKSIFDPCPRGWRVPPGDLWMSFTKTGKNPNTYSDVNQCVDENGHRPGLSMYVQGWQTGPTVYFPMQGTRAENGRFKNVGLCGNYHNATCVSSTRVNILHFHRDMAVVSDGYKDLMLFKVFETLSDYVSKSTASPVRCVRETK